MYQSTEFHKKLCATIRTFEAVKNSMRKIVILTCKCSASANAGKLRNEE